MAPALSTKDRITHSGLGAVKLGMTERQIERVAQRAITLQSARGSDCATATIAPKTKGLFTGKRLRRLYILTPKFATKEGIRVGATETRVLAAYPDALVRVPQKYADDDDLVLRNDERRIGPDRSVRSRRVPRQMQAPRRSLEGCVRRE